MNTVGGRSTASRSTFGPFVQGLIGAVALAALSSASGSDLGTVVPVAIAMGFLATVVAVAGDWLQHLAGWFYTALGVVAFVAAAASFVHSTGCTAGLPSAFRFAALALLVVIAGVSLFAAVVVSGHPPASAVGLALFGALEILITAATYLSTGMSSFDWMALAVMIPGAAVLGWFVVRATDATLGVAGVATGMQSLYAASADSHCGDSNFSGAVLIVVFCGAYFATRAVVGAFTGRRQR